MIFRYKSKESRRAGQNGCWRLRDNISQEAEEEDDIAAVYSVFNWLGLWVKRESGLEQFPSELQVYLRVAGAVRSCLVSALSVPTELQVYLRIAGPYSVGTVSPGP